MAIKHADNQSVSKMVKICCRIGALRIGVEAVEISVRASRISPIPSMTRPIAAPAIVMTPDG